MWRRTAGTPSRCAGSWSTGSRSTPATTATPTSCVSRSTGRWGSERLRRREAVGRGRVALYGPAGSGPPDDPSVKFSIRQILASAGGAVLAALIASAFGVKGTIVGVAIGSAAATIGTALVAQSIERGHEAVKQVAERVPESSTLLRRMGTTAASSSVSSAGEPGQAAAETTQMESTAPAADATA